MSHRRAGQRLSGPEGPGERPSAHREVEARGRGVQMRSTSGSRPAGIRYDGRLAVCIGPCDDSQQLAPGGSFTASDARADRIMPRACGETEFANHRSATLLLRTTLYRNGRPRGGPAAARPLVRAGRSPYGEAVDHVAFAEDFDGPDLDESVWLPHYLPVWSSRASTAATYSVRDSCLTLSIPPDQGLWCGDLHTPPMRVSGIQSGNFSGPVGSTVGQQPFLPAQTVREEQDTLRGFLPTGGHLEMRCRMTISPRSMAAFWLVGFEDRPERCGEICVVEVFGRSVEPGASAEVGMGLHAFRDPELTEDFAAPRLPVDVAGFHTYAVDWDADEAVFGVDGMEVRRCPRPPTYPMQLMLGVFDFLEWSTGDDDHLVPELVIDRIRTDSTG